MIGRIWMIATRDFTATVGSKAFLIGLLMLPLMVGLLMLLGPLVLSAHGPQVRGEIEVIDRTGAVAQDLRTELKPATIVARRTELQQQALQAGGPPPAMSTAPVLTVKELGASAEVEPHKAWLIEPTAQARHLALVVIPEDAVTLHAGERSYNTYQLYVSRGLDDATETVIREGVSEALVSARLKAKALDRADIETTLRVARPKAIVVLPKGEQSEDRGLRRFLPFICGVLLFLGVMLGGQALMTSMIEEKSSRVVEVLLAAVSPLELMWGKLLAQLGVGLLVLGVYVGIGFPALAQYTASAALDPMLAVDLGLLFIVAYLTYGALMLTVGAAVSQMADAQSLLTPVIMLLVIPYVLTMFVGQAPSSALAVSLSFVPPVNTFVMLARLASDAPPPGWEVAATLLVGLAFAALILWFAAKVFRIGLLMHGKPPDFGTLVRWARMA